MLFKCEELGHETPRDGEILSFVL